MWFNICEHHNNTSSYTCNIIRRTIISYDIIRISKLMVLCGGGGGGWGAREVLQMELLLPSLPEEPLPSSQSTSSPSCEQYTFFHGYKISGVESRSWKHVRPSSIMARYCIPSICTRIPRNSRNIINIVKIIITISGSSHSRSRSSLIILILLFSCWSWRPWSTSCSSRSSSLT